MPFVCQRRPRELKLYGEKQNRFPVFLATVSVNNALQKIGTERQLVFIPIVKHKLRHQRENGSVEVPIGRHCVEELRNRSYYCCATSYI